VPGKHVQFDDETWQALEAGLAKAVERCGTICSWDYSRAAEHSTLGSCAKLWQPNKQALTEANAPRPGAG
jgi:hypothetical protein